MTVSAIATAGAVDRAVQGAARSKAALVRGSRTAMVGLGLDEGNLVRLAGIEPTTLGFGGQYSIH